MRRHCFVIGSGLTLIVATALMGCSGTRPSNENSSGTLAIGVNAEPDTLDPQATNMSAAGAILSYAGDPLVILNPNGNGFSDGLASKWTQSADGLHWTFTLKSGVKFQNGDPVDADAVIASFKRAMAPDFKAGTIAALTKLLNDVTKVDSGTIQFDLKTPYSLFLYAISESSASIVNAKAAAADPTGFAKAPVLTGPWQIKAWTKGDRITLVKNAQYQWGPSAVATGPVKLQTLDFRIIPDSATLVAALQSGEIQATTSFPSTSIAAFLKNPDFANFKYSRQGVGLFLEFNITKAPFNNLAVRQALNYAIDKDTVVSVALQGLGSSACGPLPKNISGYWSGICDYAPTYDPKKAKQILSEDGWKPGADGTLEKDGTPLSFTLYSAGTPATWNASAQLIAQQLKAVGITMTVQSFEFATLISKAQSGEDSAHLMGYTYRNPDIMNLWFRSSQSGKGGLNLSHVNDPRIDQLITEYQTATTPDAMNTALQNLQKRVIDLALWVPLWVPIEDKVVSTKVAGATVDTYGTLWLNQASFK